MSVVDGALRGTGRLGSLSVSGSDIGPAAADGVPGQIEVAGDVSFDAMSSLTINMRGNADSLTSGGAITIADGAALVVQGANGCAPSSPCAILSSGSGITGEFTLDNRLAFLDAGVDYVGNDALLELTRNGTSFSSVGTSSNQQNVGNALDNDASGTPPGRGDRRDDRGRRA